MKSVPDAPKPHPLMEANAAIASIVDFNALVGKLKWCEEQNRILRAEINIPEDDDEDDEDDMVENNLITPRAFDALAAGGLHTLEQVSRSDLKTLKGFGTASASGTARALIERGLPVPPFVSAKVSTRWLKEKKEELSGKPAPRQEPQQAIEHVGYWPIGY